MKTILITTLLSCSLAACGHESEQYGPCPYSHPANQVIYGTGAPANFVGPWSMLPAPAEVSKAAGIPLYICPAEFH